MKTTSLLIALMLVVTGACGQRTARENTNVKNSTDMKVTELTKAEFLTKIDNYEAHPDTWKYLGNKPAIIDFYATWCGPCKMVAPILEELAKEYAGKIDIYKVDTDKEQELAAAFGIRSIPSILFIPMTGQPQMFQGAMPKSSFKEGIEKILLIK